MKGDDIAERLLDFAARVIRLVDSLPKRLAGKHLGGQLLRCGTSVAANYRAACRSRSKAEFVARIGVVAEEADEAVLWLELLTESGIISADKTRDAIGRGAGIGGYFHRLAADREKCGVR